MLNISVNFDFCIMKKLWDLAHEKLVNILGGHHVVTNIHGCQPYLKIAIYVLKSANGGLLCRPLYISCYPNIIFIHNRNVLSEVTLSYEVAWPKLSLGMIEWNSEVHQSNSHTFFSSTADKITPHILALIKASSCIAPYFWSSYESGVTGVLICFFDCSLVEAVQGIVYLNCSNLKYFVI